jgi:hypothetical protein
VSEGFKERVITERDELAERLAKLVAFLNGDASQALDEHELSRLRHQRYYMGGYLNVLDERITAFR